MFFTPPTLMDLLKEAATRFVKRVDALVERFLAFVEKFLTGNL